MPPAHVRPARRWLPVSATVVTGLLALTLWAAAFWHLGTAVAAAFTAPVTSGQVVACPEELIGPGCTIRYAGADGATRTGYPELPGLLGVSPGAQVPLWLLPDGRIRVAGWHPFVDALVYAGLAVAMTSGAVRWLARALRAGDDLTEFDLDADSGAADLRRRDAG